MEAESSARRRFGSLSGKQSAWLLRGRYSVSVPRPND